MFASFFNYKIRRKGGEKVNWNLDLLQTFPLFQREDENDDFTFILLTDAFLIKNTSSLVIHDQQIARSRERILTSSGLTSIMWIQVNIGKEDCRVSRHDSSNSHVLD